MITLFDVYGVFDFVARIMETKQRVDGVCVVAFGTHGDEEMFSIDSVAATVVKIAYPTVRYGSVSKLSRDEKIRVAPAAGGNNGNRETSYVRVR